MWPTGAAVAVLAVGAAIATNGQVLHATRFTSCLPQGEATAPVNQQLRLSDLYAQFDQGQLHLGQHASGVNLSALPSPIRNQDGAILAGTGDVLRVVMTGNVEAESAGYSNETGLLSTLVLESKVLSFDVAQNRSSLCSAIRTSEGRMGTTSNGSAFVGDSGCPYSGPVALGFAIPLASSYPLTTINTNLVALDSSNPALQLACYDLSFTPYYPDYFAYAIVHYRESFFSSRKSRLRLPLSACELGANRNISTVIIGLIALYAVLYYLGRFYAAYTTWLHDNETQLASSLTLMLTARGSSSRRGMWRTIYFDAWAGKQVVASASLRRFVTAELREIFTLIAWFSLSGTVAVEWPGFACTLDVAFLLLSKLNLRQSPADPVFKQAAWTNLVYNNSLSFTTPALPVLPENDTLPSTFDGQYRTPTSPLYLDRTLPNVLLDLDPDADGIERWSRMIGVRHQDVWATCAFTFFAICAAVLGLQLVLFGLNTLIDAVLPVRRESSAHSSPVDKLAGFEHDEALEPSLHKESSPPDGPRGGDRRSDGTLGRYLESGDFADDQFLERDGEPTPDAPALRLPIWRLHFAHAHGNLVRVLLFFHLPLTLFSTYQCTLYSTSSTTRFALAVVTLAVVCVAAPVYLIWQLHVRTARKLYTHLPTLLAFGPLYNSYSDECVLFPLVTFASNLINGVVIGAAQSTGTAQAAVILICEVAHTLVTSLWLPWGDHSAMGPLAFLLSLARIIIAVLLVVLSPTVDVSASAGSWLTYVILLCAGLVLLLFVFVVACKLLELCIRIVGGVPFDESRSPRSGGLFGAIRKLNGHGSGRSNKHRRQNRPNAQSAAARRRAIEERRRRNLHRERVAHGNDDASINTHTYMLPSAVRPAGHPGGAVESAHSLTPTNSPFPSSGLIDDDGFIMSAMSSRGWDSPSTRSGGGPYLGVQPSGPILRPGPQQWSSELSVAAPTPAASATLVAPAVVGMGGGSRTPPGTSSGFTRVGGGKATHSNPYQLAKDAETAYPPYPPVSSADMYAPRRASQGAFGAEAMTPAQRQASRPSLTLPSSSALLSNVVSPGGRLDDEHNRRLSTRARARQARKGGFFGRFKSQPIYSDDDFSDDSDDSDTAEGGQRGRKKRGGLLGLLGGGQAAARNGPVGTDGYVPDDPYEPPFEAPAADSGEKGFSVVRKPRPRPAAAGASPSLPPGAEPPSSTPRAPHVSVEAPSPPASLRGEVIDSPSSPS
jgi:hypothetical protein